MTDRNGGDLADDLDILAEFAAESLEAFRSFDACFRSLETEPENPEPVHAMFRSLHSVKGNSAFLGMWKLRALLHDLESLLSEIRSGAFDTSRISLFRSGVEMATGILRRIGREGRETVDPEAFDQMRAELGGGHASREPEDASSPASAQDEAMVVPEQYAKDSDIALFRHATAIVRKICKQTGKRARLRIESGNAELPGPLALALRTPLMHLLRNAVDHGIERPEARRQAGKPEEGEIVLRIERSDVETLVRISDDGDGLDLDAVLAQAQACGAADSGTPLSPQQVAELIFHPGLSTASDVTDVSGRGVGMDAVKDDVAKQGGSIEIATKRGAGTELMLRFPCPNKRN